MFSPEGSRLLAAPPAAQLPGACPAPISAFSMAIIGFEACSRSAEGKKRRDWWSNVVLGTGAAMLVVACLGLVNCILALEETRRRGRWTIWSIQVGICLVTAGMGGAAIRSGSKPTSSSALAYLRVLVLFTITLVIAVMALSMLSLRSDSHQWNQKQSAFDFPSESSGNPLSQPMSSEGDSAKGLEEREGDWEGGEADIMGRFLLVLGFMTVLSGCMFCAVKFLTSARQCERANSIYGQLPPCSYLQASQVQGLQVHYPGVN